jgi:hypothetical protein
VLAQILFDLFLQPHQARPHPLQARALPQLASQPLAVRVLLTLLVLDLGGGRRHSEEWSTMRAPRWLTALAFAVPLLAMALAVSGPGVLDELLAVDEEAERGGLDTCSRWCWCSTITTCAALWRTTLISSSSGMRLGPSTVRSSCHRSLRPPWCCGRWAPPSLFRTDCLFLSFFN